MSRQNPILAQQRHQVGHGAQRDKVEMVAQLDAESDRMILRSQLLQQAVAQFEHEPDGAEISPRAVAVDRARVHVRVDQQAVIERLFLRAMMVDDDHVDPLRAQVRGLDVRIGAAVERDEEMRFARLERAIDGAARKPIAILGTPRHDEPRIQAKAPQNHHEQRGAAHAINVVVAEHDDLFALRDRLAQARGRGLEIAQEERIVESGERGLQERRGGVAARRGLRAAAAQRARG